MPQEIASLQVGPFQIQVQAQVPAGYRRFEKTDNQGPGSADTAGSEKIDYQKTAF